MRITAYDAFPSIHKTPAVAPSWGISSPLARNCKRFAKYGEKGDEMSTATAKRTKTPSGTHQATANLRDARVRFNAAQDVLSRAAVVADEEARSLRAAELAAIAAGVRARVRGETLRSAAHHLARER